MSAPILALPARRRHRRLLAPMLAGALILGVWYAAIPLFGIQPVLLPYPHKIVAAMWHERATLLQAGAFTFRAALMGFLLAAAGGFLIALLFSLAQPLRRALVPYVLMVQMTPVIILTPIFVLWLGQGLPAVIAITFMICFFPIVANTTMGFTSVDRNLTELFAISRASRLDTLLRLRVPAALPYFLTGLKIAATLASIGAITGDMLGGSGQDSVGGLGFLTVTYFSQVRIPELYATGLTACIMGFIFVGAVNLLHWKVLHQWHESALRRE